MSNRNSRLTRAILAVSASAYPSLALGTTAAMATAHPHTAREAPATAIAPPAEADLTTSEPQRAPARSNPATLGLALQLAPLETFPRWGVNIEALYALSPRWRIGADGQLLLPHAYGDVTRSGFNVNGQAQFTLVNATYVRWYLGVGIGLGVLRDDYVSRSAFIDQTSLGFGVKVGTGVEVPLAQTPFVAFVEPQVRSYRTDQAVDDEWAEVNIGLRWHLP